MFPVNLKTSKPPSELTKNITHFMGINIAVNATQISDNESPDIVNMLPDDRGALDKIPGKINKFISLGEGAINCLLRYRKSTGNIYVFAHGTKLYKVDDIKKDIWEYTEIYSGVKDNRIRGFTYNDKLYMIDGEKFLYYDGETCGEVEGFIPTHIVGSPPSGGGTVLDQLNLIQPGFKQLFSGNGQATTLKLFFENYDDTEITITVNGVTYKENVNFTVNRTTGTVNLDAGSGEVIGEAKEGTNNIEVLAYKTFTGNADKIKKCTVFRAEETRVWFSGNPDYIGVDFRSGLQNPEYWPEDGVDNVGVNDNSIIGYSELYDEQIIIKEKSIHTRGYEENQGDPMYPKKHLNGSVGCIAKDSIQILDNFPTFLSSKGVYQVISISPENESNVRHISDDIDKNTDILAINGLLQMGDLEDYFSIDFNNRYYLFNPNNGIAWVYDYRYIVDGLGQWFKLENIYANCALEIDGQLYIGDSRKGVIWRMKDMDEDNAFMDEEITEDETVSSPIKAYWLSKIDDLRSITGRLLVSKIFTTIKPSTLTSAKVYIRTDRKSVWKLIKTIYMSLFKYSTITYSKFSYGVSYFPQKTRAKAKAKSVGYYQLKIENNEPRESMGLLAIAIKHLIQGEVKR